MFLVLGLYLFKKDKLSRFLCLMGHFAVRIYRDIYDAVPPVIHNFLLKHDLLHLSFKGSCISQWGTTSYRKSGNLYIFLQRNALIDIKISTMDICYRARSADRVSDLIDRNVSKRLLKR